MKKLQLAFLFLFFSGMLIPGTNYAKEKNARQSTVVAKLTGPTGSFELTGDKFVNITPVGNYLQMMTFKLPKDHPMMKYLLENNYAIYPFAIFVDLDLNGDGVYEVTAADTLAILTRGGTLKITYHVNGAGAQLPVGWDFY